MSLVTLSTARCGPEPIHGRVEWDRAGIDRPFATLQPHDAIFHSAGGIVERGVVLFEVSAPVVRVHEIRDGMSDQLRHIVCVNHVEPRTVHLEQQSVLRHQFHAGRFRIDDGLQSAFTPTDDLLASAQVVLDLVATGDQPTEGAGDDRETEEKTSKPACGNGGGNSA